MSKTATEVIDLALKEFDCGRVYLGVQIIKAMKEYVEQGDMDGMFVGLSDEGIIALMNHRFNSELATMSENIQTDNEVVS